LRQLYAIAALPAALLGKPELLLGRMTLHPMTLQLTGGAARLLCGTGWCQYQMSVAALLARLNN
jgi:hypothetical protein